MNLKTRLRHLADKLSNPRAYGKTTMLAKITQELGGILLTHNTDEATRVQRAYRGLVAKSMDINLDGFSGPFFLDNQAAFRLLNRAADKIEQLEKENQDLKLKLGEPIIVKKSSTTWDFGDV